MPFPTAPTRIRAEQIRVIYRTTPRALFGALAGAILLCFVLRGDGGPPLGPRLMWLGASVVIVVTHLLLCRWFARQPRPDAAWRTWARRFMAAAFADGCMWAFGSIWFSGFALGHRQIVLLALMLVGVTAGAVPAFGGYQPALYAFVVPLFGPYVVYNALRGSPLDQSLALYYALFAAVVLLLSQHSFGQAVMQSLHDRFENLDLLEQLRAEKERVEQASLHKSRFLAASSHDLRQPVHALGLFVAALREQEMSTEARRLAGQIEICLAGLKELFDSLLDISRLDAGAVEPRPETIPLQALLDRLRPEYAAAAAAKGLSFRFISTSAFVRADPVLLERILRNLLDNAVRHTTRGRVLIGVRRAGAGPGRVCILLADTGPGIPPDQQELVFQEFVQLGNKERDRRKGLGLGLAIVRRLARLLDCDLMLRSLPGRGTAFTLVVPAGVPCVPAAQAAPAPLQTRLRGTVLVIDDERAARTAMGGLLAGWGLDVITAGSGEEMLALAERLARAPALLISDWRLPSAEDGVAVIARLREHFGRGTPALLITGDVAPAGSGETHGLPVLYKPVSPGKLRAMIGAMLAEGLDGLHDRGQPTAQQRPSIDLVR